MHIGNYTIWGAAACVSCTRYSGAFALDSFSPAYTSAPQTAREKRAHKEVRGVSTQRSVSGHFVCFSSPVERL